MGKKVETTTWGLGFSDIQGLYRDNGKDNGSYFFRGYPKQGF